jgi:ankyrin repeat protein
MASASLFSAVRRGDTGTVRALLFPGESTKDGTGTAAEDASALGTSGPSSLPRNFGAKGLAGAVNPNFIDAATGTAALHQAVLRGDASAAALLLRHQATNPAPKDAESGWTPMHAAVYAGDVGMALLLARSGGANHADRDKEGNSWADLLNVGPKSSLSALVDF